MPIRELKDESFEQECSRCGAIRKVTFDEIAVGVERDDHFDGSIIPILPCADCGAAEFLIRSPENEPEHPSPGSFGHLHRLLTDKLHAQLVKTDHLADGYPSDEKPATKEPTDEDLAKWFKNGLKLERTVEKEQPEKDPA